MFFKSDGYQCHKIIFKLPILPQPPFLVASGLIMLDFVLTIFPIQGTYFYALGR